MAQYSLKIVIMAEVVASRVEELFFDALKLPEAAVRAAFLERACSGDAALRAAVEQALAEHAEVEQFFSASRPNIEEEAEIVRHLAATTETNKGATSAFDTDRIVGTRIGPYKLLQKIGEGGCGAVYMAEQEKPVRRKVALKIIKLGMDTKSVISRFEAERQALALMDHPNIARVLDAGAMVTGRPYFVMELVRGVRITEFCDSNKLPQRQRLELFIQICSAIQHAHQKGIVHRDVKPSNILITMMDGEPLPKVIDFGIAKATGRERLTDNTLFTAYAQFVGTPAYMSPEQAQMTNMDVDTRSDIYSLGVLLYELLTGKTPFDQKELMAAGIDAMRRTLSDREPERPSARLDILTPEELTATAHKRLVEPSRLRLELQGDLDWIVMKALEKDRSRRYQTANGLALDVQRYLDNEPVTARPPSRLYRLQKLVRRNKAVFAASVVVAATLVVGTAVSTWLWLKEREARQQMLAAEQQKAALQEQAGRAESERRMAEERRKFVEATVLVGQGKLDQAGNLLDEVSHYRAGLEAVPMYREVGDWDAKQGHWAKALSRFQVLWEINQTSNPDASRQDSSDATLDEFRTGSLLADQGELAEYERFRKTVIQRHAGTKDPVTAERVLRICLFTAADDETIRALDYFNALTVNSMGASGKKASSEMMAWHTFSLALMAYRSEDYSQTTNLCRRAFEYDRGILCRDTGIQLVRSMALAQLGEMGKARAELASCREAVTDEASRFTGKSPKWQGFWFDWAIDRVLLREAASLIESGPEANE